MFLHPGSEHRATRNPRTARRKERPLGLSESGTDGDIVYGS